MQQPWMSILFSTLMAVATVSATAAQPLVQPLEVTDARALATVPGQPVAAVYMRASSGGTRVVRLTVPVVDARPKEGSHHD